MPPQGQHTPKPSRQPKTPKPPHHCLICNDLGLVTPIKGGGPTIYCYCEWGSRARKRKAIGR